MTYNDFYRNTLVLDRIRALNLNADNFNHACKYVDTVFLYDDSDGGHVNIVKSRFKFSSNLLAVSDFKREIGLNPETMLYRNHLSLTVPNDSYYFDYEFWYDQIGIDLHVIEFQHQNEGVFEFFQNKEVLISKREITSFVLIYKDLD